MNVTHPIRGVIPTLDAPVIEVLAGTTRALSGREVHRLSGTGSVRGIQLVLARLVAQGLVRADEHASVTLYMANRSHLAWPMLEALVGLRNDLFAQIRDFVGSWKVAPVHASLFGSAARRDGGAESDIDILVIRPDTVAEGDEAWEAQVDDLRDQVRTWTGNRCQVFDIDRSRLAEHVAARDPLVESWLRDEIVLAGESIRSLIDDMTLVARS